MICTLQSEHLFAAATATQNVTYSVGTILALSVSGSPAALNITTAVAGSQPTSVSDSSTSYNITTNATSQRITGKLDVNMPSNTSLSIALAAPTGGTTLGSVTLTTTDQNLVTGISTLAQSLLSITYTFSANVSAGIITSTNRTVTLTLQP